MKAPEVTNRPRRRKWIAFAVVVWLVSADVLISGPIFYCIHRGWLDGHTRLKYIFAPVSRLLFSPPMKYSAATRLWTS